MIPHSRPSVDKKDIEAVSGVIRTGQIAQGPEVEKFEKTLASYIRVKGAVALSSGTSALHLSLLCLGIKEGDEVIIPSYTCSALLNSVMATGAVPRFADIERETYNIDPYIVEDYLRKRRKSRVRAIIVVHSFGQPADIDAFLYISDKYNIPVIEDSAQALGATYKGRMVGSYGLVSILSFYATKVITTGEGGMIISDSSDIIKKAKDIREYDEKESFKLRYNYKMTDMAAALGLSQLKRLPSFIKRREEIARIYDTTLKRDERRGKGIYYRYILETSHLERFIRLMEKDGISCRRPVFKPLHYYTGEKGYHNTQLSWKRSISIPIYPGLTGKEIRKISDSLKRYKELITW
ncbi:MAG: DegT/DnrJ/EryC1/StrS family aminotransferase [Nitrospirota bacterium]